jgi:hypothetical protein
MWPKYIIRKNDFAILQFKWLQPTCDVAVYGRITDMSLISYRGFFEIMNHHDLLYFGKATA